MIINVLLSFVLWRGQCTMPSIANTLSRSGSRSPSSAARIRRLRRREIVLARCSAEWIALFEFVPRIIECAAQVCGGLRVILGK